MSDERKSSRAQGGVSRRHVLQGAAVSAGGVAFLLGSAPPAEALMPQKAAKYQTTPKNGQMCSNCDHFEAPNKCGLVQGPIVPNGWCMFYAKKG